MVAAVGPAARFVAAPAAIVVAPAALAAFHALVLAAAAFGVVVAEPGGDLVAGAFEEPAVAVIAARLIGAVAGMEPVVALIAPSPTVVARIVTVLRHVDSLPWKMASRTAGRNHFQNEQGGAAVPRGGGPAAVNSASRSPVGTGDCKGGNKPLVEPLAASPTPVRA
jgi:hypothetical protein